MFRAKVIDRHNLQDKKHRKTRKKLLRSKKMENIELYLVGIIVLVGLSVILHCVSLVKIAQIQNSQKPKAQTNQNSANDGKKHGNQNQNQNNKNKKQQQDNRANPNPNQNNNRPVQPQQANPNKQQQQQQPQQNAPEKKFEKFEKIVSNALPLKETNTQLASRPKNQPPQNNNKAKVYSERPAAAQKQERPANAPIKQQDLPKTEHEEEKPAAAVATHNQNRESVKQAEVVTEVKNEDVQYGRR